jgi:hypothetical protein
MLTLPELSALAERLGLHFLVARLTQRWSLLDDEGVLPSAPLPDRSSTARLLSSLTRLGPSTVLAGAVLDWNATRPVEAGLVARDLLERGVLFDPPRLTALREAAGAASWLPSPTAFANPSLDLHALLATQLGAATLYSSQGELETLVEELSLGAVVELASMAPEFHAFLRSEAGASLLRSSASLLHLARLPSMALLWARLAFELHPGAESFWLLCEIALDAQRPEILSADWLARFADDDLKVYVSIRERLAGRPGRPSGSTRRGVRSTVAMIELGIAPGSPADHRALLEAVLEAEPGWRYAHGVRLLVEARSAPEGDLAPYDLLSRYVDAYGVDFDTWQKAWRASASKSWFVPSLLLLGRELRSCPEVADLWRLLLSALCPQQEFAAGQNALDTQLRAQQTRA